LITPETTPPLIPTNPATAPSLFGDHTFFLNGSGLSIVEPTGTTDTGAQTAQVVKLAGWNDADRTSLIPHEPEPTDVVVVLDKKGDGAA
jgi:hypothetical protein